MKTTHLITAGILAFFLALYALADPPSAFNNTLRLGREHEASFPPPGGQNIGGMLFGYDASVPYYSNGTTWASMAGSGSGYPPGCERAILQDGGQGGVKCNFFEASTTSFYGWTIDAGRAEADGGGLGQTRPGAFNCSGVVNGVPCMANPYGIVEIYGSLPVAETTPFVCAVELYDYNEAGASADTCVMGLGVGATSTKIVRFTGDGSLHLAGALYLDGQRYIRGPAASSIEMVATPAVSGVGMYLATTGGGLASGGTAFAVYNPGFSAGPNVFEIEHNGAIDFIGVTDAGLGPCTATEDGRQQYNAQTAQMNWCNGTTWAPYGSGGGGTFVTANHGVSAATSSDIVCNSAGTLDAGCITLGSQSFAGVKDFIAGVTSSVASGNNAFGVLTNGARVDFGAGASDYASSNGTTISFANNSLLLNGTSEWTAGYVSLAGGTTSYDTQGLSAVAGSATPSLRQTQNFAAPNAGIYITSAEADQNDAMLRIGNEVDSGTILTQWCTGASLSQCGFQRAYMLADGYLASATPHTLSSVYVNAPATATTDYGGETLPRDFTITAARFRIRTIGSGGSTNATFRTSGVLSDAGTMNCDCAFACNSAVQPYRVACLATDAGVCAFTADSGLTYSFNSIGNCTTGPDIHGNISVEGVWR